MNPSDAVAISSYYHAAIVSMFAVGYLIHMLLQVDAVARSKNNPTNLRMKVIEQNWIRLLARFFISLLGFLWIWHNPSMAPTILGYFGVNLSANAIAIMTLPISPTIAGMFGFAIDSLLAYVPILKNALPPIEMDKLQDALQQASHQVDVVQAEVAKTHDVVEAAKSAASGEPPESGK